MNRLEQLMSDYLEGGLEPGEARELAQGLEQDPGARGLFLDLYRQHRSLAQVLGPVESKGFTQAVIQELRGDRAQFVGAIMHQLAAREKPAARQITAPLSTRLLERLGRARAVRVFVGRRSRSGTPSSGSFWPAFQSWAALAATVAVAATLAAWVALRPRAAGAWVWETDQPVRVTRGGQEFMASTGFRPRLGDTLETGDQGTATVRYFGEDTLVELRERTRLTLARTPRGTLLELHRGEIQATVAPQPAERPLVVVTAQGRAKILGTRFTLAAKTASTWLGVHSGKVELTRASDQQAVIVQGGRFAVAAAGLELASRPLLEGASPEAPLPLRIAPRSDTPEAEDWNAASEWVQQRSALGASFLPFATPAVTGSVLVETLVRIDGLAAPGVYRQEGWGFGLGLRWADESVPLVFQTIQQGPRGYTAQLAPLQNGPATQTSFQHAESGNFHLKLRVDRPAGGAAIYRAKIWRQYEPEPEEWLVVKSHPCRGPLATVGLATLNCAATFTGLRLSLVD